MSREYTRKMIEMVDEGLDKDKLIINLLKWLSEDDVMEFMKANEYIEDDEIDDEIDE